MYEIIDNKGFFGNEDVGIKEANLKIGDIIKVIPLTNNAFLYKKNITKTFIIYCWNLKKIENEIK